MMKSFISLLALGTLLLWTAAPAGAQSASDRALDRSNASQYGSATVPSSTSPSAVISTDRPKQYFIAARDAFNNRNFAACAQNLRLGADILRSDAAKAHGDVADDLRGTAKDLDKLADRAQRGELTSFEDVNDKFGDAYKNMADYHYQIAKDNYERTRAANLPPGRDVETGNALNAAAQDMEDYSAVTGHELKGGTRTAIHDVRDLAGKMISGTGWVFEKAGTGINDFGNAIRDFGRDVSHNVRHPIRAHEERVRAREERESTVPPTAPAPGTQY